MTPKYIVISADRNEAEHLDLMARSVIAMTVLPHQWIIVIDGSDVETGKIADRHAMQNAWIKFIHRQDKGFRKPGGEVVDAFYEGVREITALDGSVSLS